MKTFIVVKHEFAGIHNWPNCDIEDVQFLKFEHRHKFYVTAKKQVNHSDRDIEIIMFQVAIKEFLETTFDKMNNGCLHLQKLSCEMIAELLIKKFQLSYCQVLEDNENGAEIINEP